MSGPAPVSDEVEAWLAKAREDLNVARVIAELGTSASIAAFHCQQAVEKLLKACVVARGGEAPRIHDLEELSALVPGPPIDFGISTDDLRRVTAYAVAPRYPHFPTEEAERDLPELVRIADQVAAAVEAALSASGLPPPS